MNGCDKREIAGSHAGDDVYYCKSANATIGWRNAFQGSVCNRCESGDPDAAMKAGRAAMKHAIRDPRGDEAYRQVYKGDRAEVVRRALAAGVDRDEICIQLAAFVGRGGDPADALRVAQSCELLQDDGGVNGAIALRDPIVERDRNADNDT